MWTEVTRKEGQRDHTGKQETEGSGQWLERGGIGRKWCLGIQKAESHQTGENNPSYAAERSPRIETRNEQLRVLDKLYVSNFVVLWEQK